MSGAVIIFVMFLGLLSLGLICYSISMIMKRTGLSERTLGIGFIPILCLLPIYPLFFAGVDTTGTIGALILMSAPVSASIILFYVSVAKWPLSGVEPEGDAEV